MKYVILCLLLASPLSAQAQWINIGPGEQVLAFGDNAGSLFAGVTASQLWHPYLYRMDIVPTDPAPHIRWTVADTGIDKTQGVVTSFASCGRYLFASMSDAVTGAPRPAWRSSDGGLHWQLNAGGFVATMGSYVFFASNGIYRSRDSGNDGTYQKLTSVGARPMLALGQFLLANEYGPLWRSADTGTNWTQITCPIYDIRCFAIVGNTVYAANGGLVRSLDSGATWSVVPTTFSVLSLTSHGTNLFAAASDGLHYLDSGGIWHDAGFAGKECMLIYAFDTLLFLETTASYNLYYRPIPEIIREATGAVAARPAATPDAITLYPNPSTGFISISASEDIAGIDVMNIVGVSVLSQPAVRSSSATLDLSHLPAGSYFIRITTANRMEMRRVVRE